MKTKMKLIFLTLIFCTVGLEGYSQNLPTQKNYHILRNQYGEQYESKVVKERWDADSEGRKHGRYLRYDTKGTVLESGHFSHGKKHGIWKIFTNGSEVSEEGSYVNGEKEGQWKFGSGKYYQHFKNGKLHGDYFSYLEKGRFVEGKKEGFWEEEIDRFAKEREKGNYVDGKRQGQWEKVHLGNVLYKDASGNGNLNGEKVTVLFHEDVPVAFLDPRTQKLCIILEYEDSKNYHLTTDVNPGLLGLALNGPQVGSFQGKVEQLERDAEEASFIKAVNGSIQAKEAFLNIYPNSQEVNKIATLLDEQKKKEAFEGALKGRVSLKEAFIHQYPNTPESVRLAELIPAQRIQEEKDNKEKFEKEALIALRVATNDLLRSDLFNPDSYLVKDEEIKKLNILAERLEKYGSYVKTVSIASHSKKGKASNVRDEMMYILSLNRAFVIKKYIQEKISHKHIIFNFYGCADKISPSEGDIVLTGRVNENRVEIIVNSDLPKSKSKSQELSSKFKIKQNDGIVPNEVLKENILNTIMDYYNNDRICSIMRSMSNSSMKEMEGNPEYYKKIPTEFWLPTVYSEKFGESNEKFKKEVMKLIERKNKQYDADVIVDLFFHNELKRRIYSL
jgi:antitoxin component YwqK of YwqJK toxin-antitoxin module/outer membrane protein OmpA-like peptidoglycan-associated protein